ncbi:MAG: Fe-S cluster assembly protein SufD [Woeseiaceae bacterium]
MSSGVLKQSVLQAAVDALPADGLTESRKSAASRFATLGFPTVGQEDWKYTNLAGIAEFSVDWLESDQSGADIDATANGDDLVAAVRSAVDAHWIVVRDGIPDSDLPEIPGVDIERLAAVDSANLSFDNAMSALNGALLRDGLRIRVASDATPDRPIAILNIDSPANRVSQTRLVLELADNSRLQVMECALSTEGGPQFTNSVVDINLGQGAHLDHVRLQDRHHEHSGVHRIQAHLERDAGLHHNSFEFGGALSRNDVVTDIQGTGASVALNGLYLSAGEQHIDNHTSILHSVGPSTSDEEYRGILTGRSQCVFNGKVIVAEGADGTDSRQSNHNLLLSDRAEIDTKPELEIYADDVKCAHGATVGQLDESSLFYLRTRGLDSDQAKQILTRAFAAGTLSALSIPACHDFLADKLDSRLAKLVGEVDD